MSEDSFYNAYIGKNIDESKVRSEAMRRAVGSRFSGQPRSTIIHKHPYGQTCAFDYKHPASNDTHEFIEKKVQA